MHIPIQQWSEEDRPREKLISKGKNVLTDAELIAILLGTGTRDHNALELAKILLKEVDYDLNALFRFSVMDFCKLKGIGQAKAITLVAAMELSRRKKVTKDQVIIRSSKDAFGILESCFMDLDHEEFRVLYLNRANAVIASELISMGGISGTVADGKVIFRKALEYKSTAIVLSHNHPSGNLSPSHADKLLTRSLCEFGKLIDIRILDHLIVAGNNYVSFADEGLIN